MINDSSFAPALFPALVVQPPAVSTLQLIIYHS